MQKQLDESNCAIYLEEPPLPSIEKLEQQKLRRDFKVNLKKEYKHHLDVMAHLNEFEQFKLNWDISFFKSIIETNIKSFPEYTAPEIKPNIKVSEMINQGEKMLEHDFNSLHNKS